MTQLEKELESAIRIFGDAVDYLEDAYRFAGSDVDSDMDAYMENYRKAVAKITKACEYLGLEVTEQ